MKCEEAQSHISFLPKGELPFDERQNIMDHMRDCSRCRNEYQKYLRMFYLIDKHIDAEVPHNVLDNFSETVMQQVKQSAGKKYRLNRIIWYAAAAVFIFLTLIPIFQKNESPIQYTSKSDDISITELIQNEKWDLVLQKFEGKDIPEELIPVSLLLSKFNIVDSDLANSVISKKMGKRSKDFKNLVQMLNEYQRFKSRISTTEISEYLNS